MFKFLNWDDRKDLSVWLCVGVPVSPLVLPQWCLIFWFMFRTIQCRSSQQIVRAELSVFISMTWRSIITQKSLLYQTNVEAHININLKGIIENTDVWGMNFEIHAIEVLMFLFIFYSLTHSLFIHAFLFCSFYFAQFQHSHPWYEYTFYKKSFFILFCMLNKTLRGIAVNIQFKFICMALFTIQIIAKQFYRKFKFLDYF